MKLLSDINLGYNDATSYKNNRLSRDMFEKVFVKDDNFERLMRPDTYFLIGDKGTGKTAYAVFLENKEHKNTKSKVIDIASTDYGIFIRLQKLGFLQLSDFSRVWKVILLMLMASEIEKADIALFGPKRSKNFENLKDKIFTYYQNAFIPEVSSTFRFILDSAVTNASGVSVGLSTSILGFAGDGNFSEKERIIEERSVQNFQNSLLALEKDFCDAFRRLKLSKSKFLFIDSIDIKPDDFSESEFDSCIRGLGQAIWDVNTNVFRAMPEGKGILKAVLSIRTDLFPKLGLHNQANKVRDNGILLDWRTTYEGYRDSKLFRLCNRLLSYDNDGLETDSYWDNYFPWSTNSTSHKRDKDDSFINCIRLSLSRPRDMISIMKAIQNTNRKGSECAASSLSDFEANETENEISNYYIDEARDWCLQRFSSEEFETLLFFFQFLNGKSKFTYSAYVRLFDEYIRESKKRRMSMFSEHNDKVNFLQILFDLNMIFYLDKDKHGNNLYRFCYREREIHNLTPKVKTDTEYFAHYALLKALNLGRSSIYVE